MLKDVGAIKEKPSALTWGAKASGKHIQIGPLVKLGIAINPDWPCKVG